jgi:uncharacterized membrane protein YqgA involved in biofilm formation
MGFVRTALIRKEVIMSQEEKITIRACCCGRILRFGEWILIENTFSDFINQLKREMKKNGRGERKNLEISIIFKFCPYCSGSVDKNGGNFQFRIQIGAKQ